MTILDSFRIHVRIVPGQNLGLAVLHVANWLDSETRIREGSPGRQVAEFRRGSVQIQGLEKECAVPLCGLVGGGHLAEEGSPVYLSHSRSKGSQPVGDLSLEKLVTCQGSGEHLAEVGDAQPRIHQRRQVPARDTLSSESLLITRPA